MESMESNNNHNDSLVDYQRLEIRDEDDQEETSLQIIHLSTTSRPVIVIYPTIAPETVVIPIVVSIIVFPIFVVSAICLLRYYNIRARAKDKFRSGMQSGAAAIFSLSKIGATNKPPVNRRHQYTDRFLCMPELGLDTLIEEKEISGGTSDEANQKSSATSRPPNGIITNLRSSFKVTSKGHSPSGSSLLSPHAYKKNSSQSKRVVKRVTYNEDHMLMEAQAEDKEREDEESPSTTKKNITQIVINGASPKRPAVMLLGPEGSSLPLLRRQENPDEILVASHSFSKIPISVTKVKDLGTV